MKRCITDLDDGQFAAIYAQTMQRNKLFYSSSQSSKVIKDCKHLGFPQKGFQSEREGLKIVKNVTR